MFSEMSCTRLLNAAPRSKSKDAFFNSSNTVSDWFSTAFNCTDLEEPVKESVKDADFSSPKRVKERYVSLKTLRFCL